MPSQKRSGPLHKRSSATGPSQAEPYAADTPVTDPAQDRFKRHPFAERLAATLARRDDPTSIVVHINGAWGEGKTTVLEFVRHELAAFSNVISVRFNPWRITDETTLLLSFFGTIATALDQSPKMLRERAGDFVRKYGSIVSELDIDVCGAKVTTGKALTKLAETLSHVTVDEHHRRIEELLARTGQRVVVFIDDIDRLDRNEAQAVFKLLKLTGNLSNISYLLAFDRNIVAHAIGEQYGTGPRAGYEYLEKIVQVSLNLPIADKDTLAGYCLELLQAAIQTSGEHLTTEEERDIQTQFVQYLAPDVTTPRVAKHYANSVAFMLPLLAGELNKTDLLLLEAVKCFFPILHEHLRKNPSLYTGNSGWDSSHFIRHDDKSHRDKLNALLEELGPATAVRAGALLKRLFPQLNGLFRQGKYGGFDDERAEREQRVCLQSYLKRYLTNSIPGDDISDKDIENLFRRVIEPSPASDAAYKAFLRPGQEFTLLLKIRARIASLNPAIGEQTCLVIARNGRLLPDPPGAFADLLITAALTIRAYLRPQTEDERARAARNVLTQAEPITMAVHAFRQMELQRNEHDSERLFPPAVEDELRLIVANRIAAYAADNFVLTDRPAQDGPLLYIWKLSHGSAAVQAQLRKEFAARPEAVEVFLASFSNPLTSMRLDERSYEALRDLAAPEDVLAALSARGWLDPDRKDGLAQAARDLAVLHKAANEAHPNQIDGDNQT